MYCYKSEMENVLKYGMILCAWSSINFNFNLHNNIFPLSWKMINLSRKDVQNRLTFQPKLSSLFSIKELPIIKF